MVALECDAMGGNEDDTMAAEAVLYLGSRNSFSVTEGHSFSRPLSNLISHLFSPLASTIVP